MKDEFKRILSDFAIVSALWLATALSIVGFWWYVDTFHPLFMYGVSENHIAKQMMPTDCNYDVAPVGEKGCHYQKYTLLLNASGHPVGGEHVLPNGDIEWQNPKGQITDMAEAWEKITDTEAFEYNEAKRRHLIRQSTQPTTSDPVAVEACIRRLKARKNDPDVANEEHVVNACTSDPSLGL